MARKRRPSLLGGLLWTGLGVAFLVRNFGIGPDFWSMAARYWPILLVLLGLGKIIDYFRQKEGVSLRAGEVVGILFLLLIGSVASRISRSPIGNIISDIPIRIGETQLRPGRWLGNSYTFSEEKSYPIPAPGVLRIENSYGSVVVTPGAEKELRVHLRKVVYHDEEARAKGIAGEIVLEGGASGGAEATKFVLRTNRESLASKDYRFRTELEIQVPRKSQLEVQNSFGEVVVSNLEGKLDVATTHSRLEVRDCTGTIAVSNRYAESRLTNLAGTVRAEMKGKLYVEGIRGDLVVHNEYNPVEIRDVDGKVDVTNSEASIRLEKVTKPVVITGRGNNIDVVNLADSLKVTASHQRVRISEVASNVTVDSRYSQVTLKQIKGNVEMVSNSDRITLEEIGGLVKVQGQGSSVQASTIEGPVDIATSLKDVAVNDFAGSCRVTNEFSDVSLKSTSALKGDIFVKNRNGAISLVLPEDAGFQIDATARNGRVVSDFPELVPAESSGESGTLKGKVKGGGPKIQAETEYSNIHVRTLERDSSDEERRPKRRRRDSRTQ